MMGSRYKQYETTINWEKTNATSLCVGVSYFETTFAFLKQIIDFHYYRHVAQATLR